MMRSSVVTVGTTPVNVLDGLVEVGSEIGFVLVPRADMCVVTGTGDSYDTASFGSVGPTGDVESVSGTTRGAPIYLVAAGAGEKVAVFWGV